MHQTMTHEVPQEVQQYSFPLDVDQKTAVEIARQNLLAWLTPPEAEEKSSIIAKLYQTRKNVMEDRILEYKANGLVEGMGEYRNVYWVQGRIALRGEEPGAKSPGGYIYERNNSHQLTSYLFKAVRSYSGDYGGGYAHYAAANTLRDIIDEASKPKSRQYQRRQK